MTSRDATSLCGEAHDDGVVLLCSAHAVGPGLRLQLGADGDAWEMQYRDRFDKKLQMKRDRAAGAALVLHVAARLNSTHALLAY